jgi:hypothetical protein
MKLPLFFDKIRAKSLTILILKRPIRTKQKSGSHTESMFLELRDRLNHVPIALTTARGWSRSDHGRTEPGNGPALACGSGLAREVSASA